MPGQTSVNIDGEKFQINGKPTYHGQHCGAWPVEGLLFNSRMVQATFDDRNPETRGRWAYPDTGRWDPDRNVSEFIAMLPEYRRHGLLAVTLNLQGGSPEGYSKEQPWINSAFTLSGELSPPYMERLGSVLAALDDLGMVAIVGLFYFGQDERLADERVVRRAVDEATRWLLAGGHTNVIVEVNNECDVPRYEHEILQPHRVHELIRQVREVSMGGQRLLAGTSYRGGGLPSAAVLAASDLVLLHGNGVTEPARIGDMVHQTRARLNGRRIPIVFNEDDHYRFDQPENNMLAAVQHFASWGYFDPGAGAGGAGASSNYLDGFQNVPVNWQLSTQRKRDFFKLLAEVTGSKPEAR